MGFKGNVLVEFTSDINSTSKLLGEIEFENHKYVVKVKTGMSTDGASIPRFLWAIIGSPYVGKYRKSAILHDGLYRSQKLSKLDSDILFLDMMKSQNVNIIKRYIIFLGVIMFGYYSYYKKNDDSYSELVDVLVK